MHVVFLSIIAAYITINYLIVRWFWRSLKGKGILRWGAALLLVLLAALYPAMFRYSGAGPVDLMLLKTGAIWAGTFIYVFFLIILAAIFKRMFSSLAERPALMAAIVGVLGVFTGLAGYLNASRPIVRQIDLNVALGSDAPGALAGKTVTIASLSDIHLGRLISADRFDRMIDKIVPYRPDLVVFPGDVLDDHILLDIPAMKQSLGKLSPSLGIYGVLGNHEYLSGRPAESLAILDKMGIRMLVDQCVVLSDSLVLAGRNDYSSARFNHKERLGLPDMLAQIPDDKKSLPLVLLDHQPYHLEEAERAGVDLQLSGHTHNGQLWPVNYIVGAIYENAFGHSRRGKTHYLVSSGAGTWGPPVRTTARPEILMIRLTFRKAGGQE